jgi:hypothetical protein
MVAAMMRAVPCSRRSASLRVDSWVLELAEPWERDVVAVSLHPKRSGGETAGVPAAALALRSREAHLTTLAAASLGVREVL